MSGGRVHVMCCACLRAASLAADDFEFRMTKFFALSSMEILDDRGVLLESMTYICVWCNKHKNGSSEKQHPDSRLWTMPFAPLETQLLRRCVAGVVVRWRDCGRPSCLLRTNSGTNTRIVKWACLHSNKRRACASYIRKLLFKYKLPVGLSPGLSDCDGA